MGPASTCDQPLRSDPFKSVVVVFVVGIGVVFTKGFHEGKSVNQLGLVGIKAVFDADLGVQGEPVAEV